MKKSEKYHMAMCAVLEHLEMRTTHKLEVLEELMAEKRMAEMMEARAEEADGK